MAGGYSLQWRQSECQDTGDGKARSLYQAFPQKNAGLVVELHNLPFLGVWELQNRQLRQLLLGGHEVGHSGHCGPGY